MHRPVPESVDAAGATVWRVGRAPDPWAWIDHQYAGNARWDDPDDAREFPTPVAGLIQRRWLAGRMVGSARLTGSFVDVRASSTVAALRPRYLDLAFSLGFDDFDAAALKRAHPRALTQRLTVDLYAMSNGDGAPFTDGVRFGSRHGDDLALWAIFERPGDEPSSLLLHETSARLLDAEDSDLQRAMDLHRLTWGD